MNNELLIKAIIRMDLEAVTDGLEKTQFISVTEIDTIGRFFGINLNEIDKKFQELKDTKYRYEEFCKLVDAGVEDEELILNRFFDYVECKAFATDIIKEVAKAMQERVNRIL